MFILDLSNNYGGRDFRILSLAFFDISVLRSRRVTVIFALHKCAAIPLPIVPEPITTTLLIFMFMVGAAGFEPATLWSQTRCATRLRYAPKVQFIVYIYAISIRINN